MCNSSFHFTCLLQGHCGIINWPNFNIDVSQGKERPEGMERWGNSHWVEWSEHTHFLSLPSCVGVVVVPMNNCNNNIKEHWSQVTITHILWELPKCDEDNKVNKWWWKNGTSRLAQHRLATDLQFVKNKPTISLKCNEVKLSKPRFASTMTVNSHE